MSRRRKHPVVCAGCGRDTTNMDRLCDSCRAPEDAERDRADELEETWGEGEPDDEPDESGDDLGDGIE